MTREKTENKLQSIFGKILIYLALISVAFSVFSSFLNIFAFRIWGLNFAAIASPGDIILGTLNAFDAVGAYVGLAAVAASIAYYTPKRIEESQVAHKFFVLSYFICVAVAIFGSIIYALPNWGYVLQELNRWSVMVPWFIFSIFWFSLRKYSQGYNEIIRFVTVFVTVSLFAIFRFFTGTGGIDLALNESSRCPTNEYVVWVGVESLVTTCDPPPFRFPRTYFVVQREGVVLTNRIRQEPHG